MVVDEPDDLLEDGEDFEEGSAERPVGLVEVIPGRDHNNLRLDRFLADEIPALSRSYVQTLIDRELVRVDGRPRKAKFKVTAGERISVEVPPIEEIPLEPEPIPLVVIYEDDDLIVIDKPAGLVVHPAPGHYSGTLVNALLYHVPGMSVGGTNRPGIVHRLDKDTSGLIVVAKNDATLQFLQRQWAARSVDKGYIALVQGLVEPDEATIDAPIGRDPNNRQRMTTTRHGRAAITRFTVERRLRQTTLLSLTIETGRTHQIRVHCAFIGHPVMGDQIYGPRNRTGLPEGAQVPRQFLHAARLTFRLPDSRERTFTSPLPDDLAALLEHPEL